MLADYIFDAMSSLSHQTILAFLPSGGGIIDITEDGWSITTLGIATGTGVWKVTVDGPVLATGASSVGMEINTLAGSTVTVGDDGSVGGTKYGIEVDVGVNLVNKGTIIGGTAGFTNKSGIGAFTINNSGYIGGDNALNHYALDLNGTGKHTIINSGTLQDGYIDHGDSADTLANTGTINGKVSMGDGVDVFTNKAIVTGLVDMGAGDSTMTNSGWLENGLKWGAGIGHLTNTGTITGNVNAFTPFGLYNDVVTNSGTITGEIDLYEGNDKLTNSGTVGDVVWMGSGDDVVSNSGLLESKFNAETGNDKLTNTGTITGIIDMGTGNDTLMGGNHTEQAVDNAGSDIYKLGGGNDVYYAVDSAGNDGIDTVDGGTNVKDYANHNLWGDIYDAHDDGAQDFINLDSVAHVGLLGEHSTAAHTATGMHIGIDQITGFEQVLGGMNDDYIWGSGIAEFISGGAGNDVLFGEGGNDTIDGGSGSDTMIGGLGADNLVGKMDNAADLFVYTNKLDSTVAGAGRDTITGFEDGADKIKFIGIGDNFHFTPSNGSPFVDFDGQHGDVRALQTMDGWTIQVDTNGDLKPDMAIDVHDPGHAIAWSSGDFIFA